MKIKLFLALITVSILFGCAPTSFYQLYKTQSNEIDNKGDGLVFENDDIKVVYYFWNNFGNSSFLIFNKTDKNLFLDLSKSHLIINGIAKTYFQNRILTESSSSSLSVGSSYRLGSLNKYSNSNTLANVFVKAGFGTGRSQIKTSTKYSGTTYTSSSKTTVAKGFSISYNEKKIICIPSQSGMVIDGFNLNSTIYRDCDLYRFPSNKNIKSKKFEKENSLLTIKNVISYGFNENKMNENEIVKNNFWVSEITNYPTSEFLERKYPEYCDEKSPYLKKHFKFSNPGNFYIKYSKGTTTEFKH